MEFQLIWEIIKRRKWIVILSFLIIFLTTAIGTSRLTPVYKTSAKIVVKKPEVESYLMASVGLLSNNEMVTSQEEKNFLENQIEIATTKQISEKVISKLYLTDQKGKLQNSEDLLKSSFIASQISSDPNVELKNITDTDIIEITARAADPDEAAMIANTFAEVFIEDNIDSKKEEYKSVRGYIEQQIKIAEGRYLNALENIKKFRLDNNVIDTKTETTEAISKMFDLMNKKEANIIKISETRAKIKTLKQQLSQQDENNVSSAMINENKSIEQVKLDVIDLEIKLEQIKAEKKEDHPDVMILRQQLKKAKETLKNEINLSKKFSSELQNLEKDLAALEAQHLGLNSDIKQYMAELSTIPEELFTTTQLELDFKVSQDLYSSLLEALDHIGLAESFTISDIKLVEPAFTPDINKPASPNKTLNYAIGIFLGLLFGLSLAFITDYVDDSIEGVDDLKKYGLTVIGSVPNISKSIKDILYLAKTRFHIDNKSSILLMNRGVKDKLHAFYQLIINNLKAIHREKSINSLMIVSAKNCEGRSSIVINLGTVLAWEGKKVLIIDTDFQNPKLGKILGIRPLNGQTNIFEEGGKSNDLVRTIDEVNGLSLLSFGHFPYTSSKIIGSEKMNQIINDLKQEYDLLLFDSPPLDTSIDAALMAKYVDASIMVVESGKISHRNCHRTVEYIMRTNIYLAGVILNKFQARRGGGLL